MVNVIYLNLGHTTCSNPRGCYHSSCPQKLDDPGGPLLSVLLLANRNICHHVCKQGNIHSIFTDSYHTQHFNNFYMTNIANRLRIIYWKRSLNSLSTKTSTVFRSAPINTFWRDSKKICAYRVQYYFISFQYDNYNNIQIQRKNLYLNSSKLKVY